MTNITPKVDLVFKKLFGVEENKDLLISLINSIVSQADQVEDIILLNPYNSQNFRSDKLSILDIKAKGIDGKRFNIEIQITDEADYDKRALYYWAKLYTEQLASGDDYSTLSKAIGIHILNFISITDDDRYHNCFHILEKETGEKYFTDLELHTIELKKFEGDTKELDELVRKIKSTLDIWLAFLTKHTLLNKDRLPPELNDQHLRKALSTLEVMNFSREEREAYDDHLKWLMIEANTLKKRYEQGREEGEQKKAFEIARNLLESGVSRDLIIKTTGLSETQLNELKSKTR
jgi:predicted transposase/invertase (TIGR01784 family)